MTLKTIATCTIACGALCLLAFAYIGYVVTYLDHETQVTFFIKRIPTLKVGYYDPFSNEGDPPPVSDLSPQDRQMFAEYCKYRFGITERDDVSLRNCQTQIPSYLKNFHW